MKKILLLFLISGYFVGCSKKESQDELIKNEYLNSSFLKSDAPGGYVWEVFYPSFEDIVTEFRPFGLPTKVTYVPTTSPPPGALTPPSTNQPPTSSSSSPSSPLPYQSCKISFEEFVRLKIYTQRVFKMSGGQKYRVTYTSATVASCKASFETPVGVIAAGETIEWNTGNCTFVIYQMTNSVGYAEVNGLKFERLVPLKWVDYLPQFVTKTTSGIVSFSGNYRMSILSAGSGSISYTLPVGFQYKVSYSNMLCSKVAIPNSGTPPQLRQTAGGAFSTPLGTLPANTIANLSNGGYCTFTGGGETGGYVELQDLKFQIYKTTEVTQPSQNWEVFTPTCTKTVVSGNVAFVGDYKMNMGTDNSSAKIVYHMTGGNKYRVTLKKVDAINPNNLSGVEGNFALNNYSVTYNIPIEFTSDKQCVFTGSGVASSMVELQGLVFERLK